MSAVFFENLSIFLERNIQKQRTIIELKDTHYKLNLVYLNYFNYLLKKVRCSYSMGLPIDELTPIFRECLDALTRYKEHPKARNIFFNKEVDEYMNALTLLTWGITLPIEQPLFDKLVQHIDAEGERDAILDLLIARRQPDRQPAQTLYFPRLYSPLYDAATAQPVNTKAFGTFLARWYQTCLKKTSTHDIHTLGEQSSFSGYWAWEVAGLTCALAIDDSLYQDMRYYPKDLVVYARQ